MLDERDTPSSNPVFLDPSGKRWSRLRRFALGGGVVATILFAVLVGSVLNDD